MNQPAAIWPVHHQDFIATSFEKGFLSTWTQIRGQITGKGMPLGIPGPAFPADTSAPVQSEEQGLNERPC